MSIEGLRTHRLTLRRWKPQDLEAFAAMNADPEVMEFFPSLLSADETAAMVERIEAFFESRGFGLWAVQLNASGRFMGFVGLSCPRFEAHFTPCVEVGWRLSKEFWGNGYAAEAANEAIKDGFERLKLDEIVSFTAATNAKSIRVMEKLGMAHDPADDFLHPLVVDGSPLKPHVLYRLKRARWAAGQAKIKAR